jgi:hypothetical protein
MQPRASGVRMGLLAAAAHLHALRCQAGVADHQDRHRKQAGGRVIIIEPQEGACELRLGLLREGGRHRPGACCCCWCCAWCRRHSTRDWGSRRGGGSSDRPRPLVEAGRMLQVAIGVVLVRTLQGGAQVWEVRGS